MRPSDALWAAAVAATLLLTGCAATPGGPVDSMDRARRLIEARDYAQALQAAAAPGVGVAQRALLTERIRVDCGLRGPDLAEPELCDRLRPTTAAASAPAPATVGAQPQDDAPADRLALARRLSMDLRHASVRTVFGMIANASGLDIVFDRDVPADERLTLKLSNATAASALDKATLATGLAWRLADGGGVIVYPDEPLKQSDYQRLQVRSFVLEHADARFVAASLKTVLKARDIVVDEKLNMIVLRDTPQALRQTEHLVRLHDTPEPEVLLDVQVLEVKRSLLQQLGVQWPGQLSLLPLPLERQTPGAAFDPTKPLTLRDLLSATPGRTGAGLAALALDAQRIGDDVNLLASPRIRARNRERSRILIGERVPTVTTTTTATGLVAESVTYLDVGLKLEVQPQVYAGSEVLVRIDLEVSNILASTQSRSGSMAYRIGTRNANTALRLRSGENQLLAGLIQDTDQRGNVDVPGLHALPLVGRLFGTRHDETSKTEIVLSITPHLIRPMAPAAQSERSFDAGTASALRGRPAAEPAMPEPPAAAAPAGPSPPTGPGASGWLAQPAVGAAPGAPR
ncbi:MAG TPA: secretin N-terminal domain-containing protein [Methylibium sp.]|uniref:secretin N-terminal domain-containing protein n=1 Tax=Methylibium sp. TaxID=2067992 RepID=UPI002DB888D2|nr:secretin N-terminal domain-containing protein [Methylibium sp.]HEU4460139.1 secretin N-terminal domain-containing protein [Methylibium sp.]